MDVCQRCDADFVRASVGRPTDLCEDCRVHVNGLRKLDWRAHRPRGERYLRFCNLCDQDFYAGTRVTRFCPDCRGERSRLVQVEASWEYRPFGERVRHESCLRCGGEVGAGRYSYCSNECRDKAWDYHKNHRRRSAYGITDLTPELEQDLRRRARKCPCCGVWMVSEPYTSRSKELDHILTLHAGGTHTLDNVRVICRACNLSRPKDARDLAIQLELAS